MLDVILVGAGGFGRELRQLLPDCLSADEYQFKGYLGKDQGVGRDADAERLTLADPEVYEPQPRDRFVLAIGDMDARRRSVEALTAKGGQFISLIHPSSFVAKTVKLGRGVIIYPGKVTDADTFRIGNIGSIDRTEIEALLAAIAKVIKEDLTT